MDCSTRGKICKLSGNAILLKTGLPTDSKATFKVLDAEVKGVKGQKTWSKKRGIEALCDTVTLVDGGTEVHLKMAARIQRTCSVVEQRELAKRYEDQWRVPIAR